MANWGTGHTSRTAIIADGLSEPELLAAINSRAVYASEDEDLVIRFYAEDRVPMGADLRTTRGEVNLSFKLTDPSYAGAFRVSLIVGTVGEQAIREIDLGEHAGGALSPASLDLVRGRHFAYLEVTEVDANRMAWSAPIFIEVL
jgi:hypothetical protein